MLDPLNNESKSIWYFLSQMYLAYKTICSNLQAIWFRKVAVGIKRLIRKHSYYSKYCLCIRNRQ